MGLFDEETGGLVIYWKLQSTITSRIGTLGNARILRDAARQKWSGQFLLYTLNGGTIHQHLTGTTGARITVVHVYSWGDTGKDADALSNAVYDSMRVGFARATWNGVYINRCYIEDSQDSGYDKPMDGSDNKKFWSRLMLRITHTEDGGT